MPLIGDTDSQSGRHIGYLAMQSRTYHFTCGHCKQPSTSTSYNAGHCQAKACQEAKRKAANERHAMLRKKRECRLKL